MEDSSCILPPSPYFLCLKGGGGGGVIVQERQSKWNLSWISVRPRNSQIILRNNLKYLLMGWGGVSCYQPDDQSKAPAGSFHFRGASGVCRQPQLPGRTYAPPPPSPPRAARWGRTLAQRCHKKEDLHYIKGRHKTNWEKQPEWPPSLQAWPKLFVKILIHSYPIFNGIDLDFFGTAAWWLHVAWSFA